MCRNIFKLTFVKHLSGKKRHCLEEQAAAYKGGQSNQRRDVNQMHHQRVQKMENIYTPKGCTKIANSKFHTVRTPKI
jgi:hypothetical protein